MQLDLYPRLYKRVKADADKEGISVQRFIVKILCEAYPD